MEFYQFLISNMDVLLALLGLISNAIGFINIRKENKLLLSLFFIFLGFTLWFISLQSTNVYSKIQQFSQITSGFDEDIPKTLPSPEPTIIFDTNYYELTPTNELLKYTPTTENNPNLDPLRPHFPVYVGSGVFEDCTFSDGMAEYSYDKLANENKFNIQRIIYEDFPNGCDTARYDSNIIWVTGSKQMKLTINNVVIGEYLISDDPHGYIVNYPVKIGDKLCVIDFKPSSFAIYIGPDIYFHYDSLCYRGFCK